MKQHAEYFRTACKALDLMPEVVTGHGRHPRVVAARAIIASVLHSPPWKLSFPEIAAVMRPRGTSHTSILEAFNRWNDDYAQLPEFQKLRAKVVDALSVGNKAAERPAPKARVRTNLLLSDELWCTVARRYHRAIDGDNHDHADSVMDEYAKDMRDSFYRACESCCIPIDFVGVRRYRRSRRSDLFAGLCLAAEAGAKALNTSIKELHRTSRHPDISKRRRVLCYVLRNTYREQGVGPTLGQIAEAVFDGDHTSVMHCLRRAQREIDDGEQGIVDMIGAATYAVERSMNGASKVGVQEDAQVELQEVVA